MASSGKTATSQPSRSAVCRAARTHRTLPSRSPTTLLIWQAATRSRDIVQSLTSPDGTLCRVPAGGHRALGGAGLNYSIDVDVMFVRAGTGDAEDDARAARAALDVARTCFRVDVDLRPEGRDGPLVRSLASYEAYWDRWAQTWEFQALLKARLVAGADDLGRAFVDAASRRVWGRRFDAEDVRAVRTMKARAEGEVTR